MCAKNNDTMERISPELFHSCEQSHSLVSGPTKQTASQICVAFEHDG